MARRIGMGGLAALSAVVLTACGSIPLPLPSLPSLPIIGRPSAPSAPIADRRIDLSGSCSQTEEDGFREQATLTSPAYPPGPYRFINREFLIITYRT
ncbi:hypothetical protein ACQCR9_26350, partial [Ralstonia pseudosolanacearum]